MKYFLSSAVILAIILAMNFITGMNTAKWIDILENKCNSLKKRIEQNSDEIDNLFYEVDEVWNDANKTLSLYIEHEELDKAEMEMVQVKSNIKIKDFDDAIMSIDKVIFQLNHIKEKNKLRLKNIF